MYILYIRTLLRSYIVMNAHTHFSMLCIDTCNVIWIGQTCLPVACVEVCSWFHVWVYALVEFHIALMQV